MTIYINIYNIIFIYIVICVRSLVEIAPGVPELCRNIHTNIHFFIYIDMDLESLSSGTPLTC
jgi:hypothetical protein